MVLGGKLEETAERTLHFLYPLIMNGSFALWQHGYVCLGQLSLQHIAKYTAKLGIVSMLRLSVHWSFIIVTQLMWLCRFSVSFTPLSIFYSHHSSLSGLHCLPSNCHARSHRKQIFADSFNYLPLTEAVLTETCSFTCCMQAGIKHSLKRYAASL